MSSSRKPHGSIHRIREFELEKVRNTSLERQRINNNNYGLLSSFRSLAGEFGRRIRYSANRGRRMVRQNFAGRASGDRHRDGPESAAKAVRLAARLLPRVPLRTASRRAQKHRHRVRRRIRNGRLLRIHTGVRAARRSHIKCIGYRNRRDAHKARRQTNSVRIGLHAHKVSEAHFNSLSSGCIRLM